MRTTRRVMMHLPRLTSRRWTAPTQLGTDGPRVVSHNPDGQHWRGERRPPTPPRNAAARRRFQTPPSGAPSAPVSSPRPRRSLRLVVGVAALAVLPFLSGCAMFTSVPPLDPLPEQKVVLAGVEYTPQEEENDCGPACLTTVMRHLGSPLTLTEVKAMLKQTKDGGTLWIEMLYGARRNGFNAALGPSDLNDLRRKLLAGQPVIIMIHGSPDIVELVTRRMGHYVVAVGYDDAEREFLLHSGRSAFTPMSYRQVQLRWGRARFQALVVTKHKEE